MKIDKIQGHDKAQDIRPKKEVKGTEKFDEILKSKEQAPVDKTDAAKQAGAARKGDAIHFSNEAEKAAFVKQVVDKTPDIRAEKVDKIKQLIAAGKYDVSADELAQKLIDIGVADKLLKG